MSYPTKDSKVLHKKGGQLVEADPPSISLPLLRNIKKRGILGENKIIFTHNLIKTCWP